MGNNGIFNASFLHKHHIWLLVCFLSSALVFGQTEKPFLQLLQAPACKNDQTQLKATTNGTFVKWEANNHSTEIAEPFSTQTWVRANSPSTLFATAAFYGDNIIANGSFENELSGFTSEYTLLSSISKNGQYAIGTNPNNISSAFVHKKDITSGLGNMLIVDGSNDSTKAFYQTKVAVKANKRYIVSVWICNIHEELAKPNPDTAKATTVHLQIEAGAKIIGHTKLPTDTAWHKVSFYFQSAIEDSISMQARSLNRSTKGNDFAVDEIYMAEETILKSSIQIKNCSESTVFSPDGDGQYESFYIADQGMAKVYDLDGNLVKELQTPNYWDGTKRNGSLADAGYYAIVVNNETVHRISLMR
jgi:hypothetical protein